jgi:hypothetical protein
MINRLGECLDPHDTGSLAAHLEFIEFIVEWEDGKQLWTDTHHQAGKSIRYRHRMNGFQPFYIQATRALPDGGWETVWDLEWTEPDLRLTREDLLALKRQRVPGDLIDRLFRHPDIELSEILDITEQM